MMISNSAAGLAEVLPILETATRLIRALHFSSGAAALGQASTLLSRRPLDAGDRMILGKVFGRLRRASRETSFEAADLSRLESFVGWK